MKKYSSNITYTTHSQFSRGYRQHHTGQCDLPTSDKCGIYFLKLIENILLFRFWFEWSSTTETSSHFSNCSGSSLSHVGSPAKRATGVLLTIIRKWRRMSRENVCVPAMISSRLAFGDRMYCVERGGLGRGIKVHGSWLCCKLTYGPQLQAMNPNVKPIAEDLSAQLSFLSRQMDVSITRGKNTTSLTIVTFFSDPKKISLGIILEKYTFSNTLYFGLAAWVTVSQLPLCLFFILFFAGLPVRRSQTLRARGVHGKTSRGCWDHPP